MEGESQQNPDKIGAFKIHVTIEITIQKYAHRTPAKVTKSPP